MKDHVFGDGNAVPSVQTPTVTVLDRHTVGAMEPVLRIAMQFRWFASDDRDVLESPPPPTVLCAGPQALQLGTIADAGFMEETIKT
jgi:hypothetical protein